ncbi:hypothetical protein [Kitasatospora terrestris]|uniref:hypothetical protein n=1 Tax=Kitasatospora terrestris TaxID=258051 RepID=UPI0031E9A40B
MSERSERIIEGRVSRSDCRAERGGRMSERSERIIEGRVCREATAERSGAGA